VNLPDIDLAYFPEHTEHFDDYVEAVEWAQDYARRNRDLTMEQIVGAVLNSGKVPPSSSRQSVVFDLRSPSWDGIGQWVR